MAPNAPYGLSAAILHIRSSLYAHVFWMVSSLGDRAYEVQRRKQGDPNFIKVATVPAHNPSTAGANYLDYIAGAREGEVYEYRIIAYDLYNHYSPYSAILQVLIKSTPDTPYGLSAAVSVHASGPKKPTVYYIAHVFWMVSSRYDSGYEVERRKPGYGDFLRVAIVAAHNPSTDGANVMDYLYGTKKGDRYEYRIRAFNQYGYSPYSLILPVNV